MIREELSTTDSDRTLLYCLSEVRTDSTLCNSYTICPAFVCLVLRLFLFFVDTTLVDDAVKARAWRTFLTLLAPCCHSLGGTLRRLSPYPRFEIDVCKYVIHFQSYVPSSLIARRKFYCFCLCFTTTITPLKYSSRFIYSPSLSLSVVMDNARRAYGVGLWINP